MASTISWRRPFDRLTPSERTQQVFRIVWPQVVGVTPCQGFVGNLGPACRLAYTCRPRLLRGLRVRVLSVSGPLRPEPFLYVTRLGSSPVVPQGRPVSLGVRSRYPPARRGALRPHGFSHRTPQCGGAFAPSGRLPVEYLKPGGMGLTVPRDAQVAVCPTRRWSVRTWSSLLGVGASRLTVFPSMSQLS